MGLGNGNPTSGDKGSNWRYEYNVLKALCQISTSVTPPGGLATETTLLAVLTAIAGESEFETFIVIDTGNANAVLRVVYVWNTVTHTFDPPIYYDAAGAVVVPVGPLIFQDNSAVLALINGKLNSLGQKLMAGSMPVVIASDQSVIPVALPSGAQVITSVSVVDSLASPVTAGATGVTFTTDATFAGTINGVARAASTVYSFTSAEGKTLPAIAYTVTAGTLIIDKIV